MSHLRRAGDWLSNRQFLFFNHAVDCIFVMNHCLVDPAIVISRPKIHHGGGTRGSHQITISLHFQITSNQVQVGSFFIV